MRLVSVLKACAVSACALLPTASFSSNGPAATTHAATEVSAGSIIQDTGVANRLVVGELLRTLTQEIPAAACHLHNQINVEDATDNIVYGVAQIDELLDALIAGDLFWGITTPETRRKTLAEIAALREDWVPVQVAATRLLDDPTDLVAASLVYGAADMLEDRTYKLLTTLDSQYSGAAEILRRDVMFIQLSGRMAAMNQHLALEACLLASNGADPEVIEDFNRTISNYQNSLHALSHGYDAMGILPPQTPGIADKLSEIAGVWTQNRKFLDRVALSEPLSETDRHALYYGLIDERVVILDLLFLYQDHAKVH
ncbi:type IV pili methyl-accepting chemotaxis transducer N-terminal domain-containing protein [Yoonia litorea]|nr:type IV pili methyl-accepting chemotaxis transducer N-terminal domain-containing protein [Yoonia litorea]